jgi:putative restriction endonuclease
VEDWEWRARLAAFEWLAERGAPDVEITRTGLERGFELNGQRVALIGPQGIWKPAGFRLPLSITTIPSGPYSDRVDEATNQLRYSYRGTYPDHRDNVGLRLVRESNVPLVYFFRTDPGYYIATFPVYVIGDDPADLAFWVKVDTPWSIQTSTPVSPDPEVPLRRDYATRIVRQRLFQAEFRRRVVDAYRRRCAICRLRHRELLDAAHITADSMASGEPVVSNGMALCKLHHAAFDGFFLAVTPDYRVVVRPSILREADGPMLIVGLQQIHDAAIVLPASEAQRPNRDRLAERYEAFKNVS